SSVQDFSDLPPTCTTQAPHCDVSQPTWVPVSRRCSRKNCTSKVRSSTLPDTALPFTVIDTAGMAFLQNQSPSALFPKIRAQSPVFRFKSSRRHRLTRRNAPFSCFEPQQV